MKHTITFFMLAAVALSAVMTLSCTSNKPISEDLTAKELIQRGQEAFEKGKNKLSLQYFNAVVDRYGSDPALYTEARYEIGHLYMRNKDYENAVLILEELTTLYVNSPVGTFPPAYDKLAKLELAKIPEEKLAAIHAKQKEKEEQARKEIEAEYQREQMKQELPSQEESAEPEPAPEAQTAEQEASSNKEEQAAPVSAE